jgi:hypothetical protein
MNIYCGGISKDHDRLSKVHLDSSLVVLPDRLTHAQPLVEHIARMMEPPPFSEDGESIHPFSDDDFHLTMPTTTYQLSRMCLLPSQTTTPMAKTAVKRKRPYQLELITSSSPQPSASKRQKRTRNKGAGTMTEDESMTEDDSLLLELRECQKLRWKDVAQRFGELKRCQFRVPTLQMRYFRLKKKMPEKKPWGIEDVSLPNHLFFSPCLRCLPRYNT